MVVLHPTDMDTDTDTAASVSVDIPAAFPVGSLLDLLMDMVTPMAADLPTEAACPTDLPATDMDMGAGPRATE